MSDLLGFTSISLIFLLIIFITIRWPAITKILYVAFAVRVIFLLIGNYVIDLPDSTADSVTFETRAWRLGQEGFVNVLSNFPGPNARFISWLIAIPYSVLGHSILMAKSISLFFGVGSVLLGWLLARRIWNNNIANKVGWTMALFPSLVLYSVIVMREAYMVFFLLIALFGVVSWLKTSSFKSIILAMTGFTGATFFHGGMSIGAMVFLATVGASSLKRFFKLLLRFHINIKIISFLFLIFAASGYYLSNKINLPYLGSFETSTNIEVLLQKTQIATRGEASWPQWTVISSPAEMLYKGPIRSIYLTFSPFPWDVNKLKHLIGMFDAFLYMYLSYLIFKNRKVIWNDPILKIIFIMLACYIFVFGIGVGNFGTGIRHRSKFVVLFILLAAPLLKKVILSKNQKY